MLDMQEMELGAAIRPRQNQAAPDEGGWSAFFGLFDRSVPNTNPYGNFLIRADGLAALDGWPTSPRIEALHAAWLDAGTIEEQRRICVELQLQLWQDVPYIPDGRVLAVHRLSQGSARRAARLLCDLLRRPQSVTRTERDNGRTSFRTDL